VKCGFPNDHVIINDKSAVKLSENEVDDWHSLQLLGMQFEDYTTCDIALEICGIQSVDQVLDQRLTGPEEEEKVAEHKVLFLDALIGLEATRKHMCQFDTEDNIIVMCNKVENESYRLRAQEKRTQDSR
jgi:hypothetical protein